VVQATGGATRVRRTANKQNSKGEEGRLMLDAWLRACALMQLTVTVCTDKCVCCTAGAEGCKGGKETANNRQAARQSCSWLELEMAEWLCWAGLDWKEQRGTAGKVQCEE